VGLAIEDVNTLYGHLVYFIFYYFWYIMWPFDIVDGHLVYFSRFGVLHQEKLGNPGSM
jgi:hypothetical protein